VDDDQKFVPPRSAAERYLARLWSDVLGVSEVGVQDNLFALGGHSLLATRLISRVRDAFDVDIPLKVLFEEPTIARLVSVLAEVMGGVEVVEETATALLEIERLDQGDVQARLAELKVSASN
jgi:acyl carrier protein